MSKVSRLYIGHNINGHPYWSFEELERVVESCLYTHGVDGATLERGQGLYKGKREDCTIVTLIDCPNSVASIARTLCTILRQECILVTTTTEDVVFVWGPVENSAQNDVGQHSNKVVS